LLPRLLLQCAGLRIDELLLLNHLLLTQCQVSASQEALSEPSMGNSGGQ
jgi:hypothetical protein